MNVELLVKNIAIIRDNPCSAATACYVPAFALAQRMHRIRSRHLTSEHNHYRAQERKASAHIKHSLVSADQEVYSAPSLQTSTAGAAATSHGGLGGQGRDGRDAPGQGQGEKGNSEKLFHDGSP
jgi:hypothetical protein